MYLIIGKNEGGGIPIADDQRKAASILSQYKTADYLKATVFVDGEHKE
jgi:hypothetical protein